MSSIESLMARAALFITNQTWDTNWNVLLTVFDIAEIGKDTTRLYRSQSWKDDDYPERVHNLFMSIVEYDEKLALNFIKYVINKEFDLTDETVINKDKGLLTALGLIDDGSIKTELEIPTVTIENYLNIKVFNNDFYYDLQHEINKSYSFGIYTAVRMLSRKMIENLMIDILRKKYGTSEIELYYKPENGRFQGFDVLRKNLLEKVNTGDFDGISTEFNGEFFSKINRFRTQGNASAHSLELLVKKQNLTEDQVELSYIIKMLVRVLENC